MGCCSSKSMTFSPPPSFYLPPVQAQPTTSNPDNNISHELLLTIPGCKVYLMDAGKALDVASGDFKLLRICDSNESISTVIKVGNELQWPLTKDQPVVKLDAFRYIFALPMKNDDNPLRYGVTFSNVANLEVLESFLKENSAFTCSVKKESEGNVDQKEFVPPVKIHNNNAYNVNHQDSTPVVTNSSIVSYKSSSDIIATESPEIQVSKSSGQHNILSVQEGNINHRPPTDTFKLNTINENKFSAIALQIYQELWEQLVLKKDIDPSKSLVQTSGKYNRVWMLEGSKPEDVLKWYNFGAIASIYTTAPEFPEISKLPDWIRDAVHESWRNSSHLNRSGDILELKFISAAPEIAGEVFYPAFHFIKLQRINLVAFNNAKATNDKTDLASTVNKDDMSTRRAWGLWVCLVEMEKVNYPFKIFSKGVDESFLLNSMTEHITEFAESLFEKKRLLIWENKLPAIEVTKKKACNMMHVGQWHTHICPYCQEQEKALFGTKVRPIRKTLNR